MHTFPEYSDNNSQADREGWFMGTCVPEGDRPEIYAITDVEDPIFVATMEKSADQWAREFVSREADGGSLYHQDAIIIVDEGRRESVLRHLDQHQCYPDWVENPYRDYLESNGFVHRKFGYPTLTSLGELEIGYPETSGDEDDLRREYDLDHPDEGDEPDPDADGEVGFCPFCGSSKVEHIIALNVIEHSGKVTSPNPFHLDEYQCSNCEGRNFFV